MTNRSHFDGEPAKPAWRVDGTQDCSGEEGGATGAGQCNEAEGCTGGDEEDSTSQIRDSSSEDDNDEDGGDSPTGKARLLNGVGSSQRHATAHRRRQDCGGRAAAIGWGGKVALVLEMWVQSTECRSVRHMLHEIEEFGKVQVNVTGLNVSGEFSYSK